MSRQHAKELRHNSTDAEKRLWERLRARRLGDLKFRRQVPVGPYIADFVCFEHRLIVEVDGSQHEGSENDVVRDAWLRANGYRILRVWNNHVSHRMEAVLEAIVGEIEDAS